MTPTEIRLELIAVELRTKAQARGWAHLRVDAAATDGIFVCLNRTQVGPLSRAAAEELIGRLPMRSVFGPAPVTLGTVY